VTTSPRFVPLARNVVERIDRRYLTSLSTAPVLDAAGELLHAWCVTAIDHGADMSGDYPGDDWAQRLAAVALEITTRSVRETRPSTPEKATALLDTVAARLSRRGITTHRDVLYVPLPRAESTPAWGAFEPRPLGNTVRVTVPPAKWSGSSWSDVVVGEGAVERGD